MSSSTLVRMTEANMVQVLEILATPAGFEPATFSLEEFWP
jgi:hypothetical protein